MNVDEDRELVIWISYKHICVYLHVTPQLLPIQSIKNSHFYLGSKI